MDFAGPLFDTSSPVHALFKQFNESHCRFLEEAGECAKETPNARLGKAITEECERSHRAAFSPAPSEHQLIEVRDQLLATEPKTWEVKLRLGNVSLFLYDFYTASLCYSDVLAEDVELSAGEVYLISIVMTHFHCWKGVIDLLQPIVHDLGVPYRSDAFFRLGIAYKQTNQYVRALECFQNSYARPPMWVTGFDIAVEISDVYFAQGNLKYACSQIESVTSRTPAVVQQQAFIYLCSDDSVKMDMGISMLSEYEATGLSVDLLYLKGRLLYKRGRIKEAFHVLYSVIAMDQSHALAWCALGNIYMRMSQLADAIMCYERAITCDRDMIEAWMNFSACIEIDPQIREQHKAFIMSFDNPPLRVKQMRRRCDEPYVPLIVEPNDRDRLPSAADRVEDIFCSEIPAMDRAVLEDATLLAKSRHEELDESRDDDMGEQQAGRTDDDEEEESESESENEPTTQEARSEEPESEDKPPHDEEPVIPLIPIIKHPDADTANA